LPIASKENKEPNVPFQGGKKKRMGKKDPKGSAERGLRSGKNVFKKKKRKGKNESMTTPKKTEKDQTRKKKKKKPFGPERGGGPQASG